jgi:hypothetical protein
VPRTLRLDTARRIALAAQGLAQPRPSGRVDVRHFRRVLDRLAVVQLDSVNVLARAHYLPFFARVGPYDRAALDRWLWRSGELFEYWGHEASVMPIAHRRLLAHRMKGGWHWPRVERMVSEQPDLLDRVLTRIETEGPVRVGDFDGNDRQGPWWGWSDAKVALEYLFLTGKVTVRDRPNFQRVYDLPARVHAPAIMAEDPATDDEARVELLALGARAYGIGTFKDFADYFRLKIPPGRKVFHRLLERGDVTEVSVAGWREPAYVHRDAVAPRRVTGTRMLAPFDPVVWYRERALRLFGFHYRIEIYTPQPKRVFGYYVLPVLHDGDLAGRIDLKADRATGRLLVRGVFSEHEVDAPPLAAGLAAELELMAGWLGLSEVEVADNGDLAGPLRRAVG